MVSNPTQEYNDFIRSNLPPGITYDSVRARYVTENGKYFATYLEAKWYLDYIVKFGYKLVPESLFANGEQGAWYDPSDLTTLYQDDAGTTPVTDDGDPVGLMLDKSRGLALGPELVTNGTFDDNIDDWSANIGAESWVDGRLRLSITSENARVVGPKLTVTEGVTYIISGKISNTISGASGAFIRVASNSSGASALATSTRGDGDKVFHWRATYTGNIWIALLIDGESGSTDFDNISVRELPGNHATQATSAARPTYRTDGTLHWLECDGVDDWMEAPAVDFSSADRINLFMGLSSDFTTSPQRPIMTEDFASTFFTELENSPNTAKFAIREETHDTYPFASTSAAEANVPFIISCQGVLSAYTAKIEVDRNGVVEDDLGDRVWSLSTKKISLFSRGLGSSQFLSGTFHGLVLVEGDAFISKEVIQDYLADKSGVTL